MQTGSGQAKADSDNKQIADLAVYILRMEADSYHLLVMIHKKRYRFTSCTTVSCYAVVYMYLKNFRLAVN